MLQTDGLGYGEALDCLDSRDSTWDAASSSADAASGLTMQVLGSRCNWKARSAFQ